MFSLKTYFAPQTLKPDNVPASFPNNSQVKAREKK